MATGSLGPAVKLMTSLLTCQLLLMTSCNAYITFIAERMPLKGERAAPGSPWPMPREWSRDNNRLTFDPASLEVTSNMAACDVMAEAVTRYRRLFQLEQGRPSPSNPALRHLRVEVTNTSCQQWPHQDMDESYQIEVTEEATLKASTQWGALRGLETFSQLIYTENGELWINKTSIQDKPRFAYRGSLIDTSRHFLPLPIIFRHLDAMAYNKLNVLHWHVVDAQAFPFVSTALPLLSQKGAYTSKHVYSPEDVQKVINYARMRGIRVIPEFDSPGHAHSWGEAYPDLLTPCWKDGQPDQAVWGKHWKRENFDPSRNFSFQLLETLLGEVKRVFPDEFIHLGQDEAHYYCWQSSPNISAFLEKMGYPGTDISKLELYFSQRVVNMADILKFKAIVWQDPADNGVQIPTSAVVEVWKKEAWQKMVTNMTSQGYKVILSAPWYLNYIAYGEDWRNYYNISLDFLGEREAALLLGGEACMWAEFVDGTNFLQRYWPRASAVAERLWSPTDVIDLDSAAFRLDQQRCRMLRRRIPAEPILPGYCGDYEWGFELSDDPLATPAPPGQTTCPPGLHPTNSGHTPLPTPLPLCLFLLVLIALLPV